MDLAAWMTETSTKPEAFAAAIPVHLVTVYHWQAKRKFPRIKHLRRIEALTDGRVTAADFVPSLEDDATVSAKAA